MEMMVHGRRDDQHHLGLGLGLSLSLSLGAAANDQPAAAAPRHVAAAAHVSPSPFFSDRRSTAACHDEMIAPLPFLRGIDVNRTPAAAATARGASCSEEEEETGASSPNSTLSSLSGKRGAPAGSSRATAAGAGSDDEDSGGGGGGSRKKLRLSKDQAAVLEETFKEHNTLNPKQKAALARDLKLKPRQVEVWFQNRRARTKLKQTEVDCELLKRCCETLTDENRRLHRELRDLKLAAAAAPRLFGVGGGVLPPPTTLAMCPSCERVVVSNSGGGGSGEVGRPARPVPSRPWMAPPAKRPSA